MKKTRYDFWIGINDKLNGEAVCSVEDIKNELANFFFKEEIGFSITNQIGGYLHENGKYIIENSIKLTVIGDFVNDEIIEFIDGIKQKFNQESVLMVEKKVESQYE